MAEVLIKPRLHPSEVAAKKGLIHQYEKDSRYQLISWKGQSDAFFGTNEAIKVWQELMDHQLVPGPTKNLVFISPSALVPTHEAAIFRYDQIFRSAASQFFVGDLADIGVQKIVRTVKSFAIQQAKHKQQSTVFQRIFCDGFYLPFAKDVADVVWSRKGDFWYAALFESRKKESDFSGVVNRVLDNYHNVLKPGGIVVFDNIPGFEEYENALPKTRSTVRDPILPIRYPDAPGQYEPSTIDMVRRVSPNFFDNLSDRWETIDLGQGVTSVKVLQKI